MQIWRRHLKFTVSHTEEETLYRTVLLREHKRLRLKSVYLDLMRRSISSSSIQSQLCLTKLSAESINLSIEVLTVEKDSTFSGNRDKRG